MTTRRPARPYYDSLYLSNYATIQVKDAVARVEGVGDVAILGPAGLQHARSGWTRTSYSRGI